MKKLTIIITIILIANRLNGQIINIPADYPTIQQGIDAAYSGDTVMVAPGMYVENISYYGKNITVASYFLITQDTSLISQTIIDGNQNGSVVTLSNGEDSTAHLIGFTITNGFAGLGGGIYCESSPTLLHLVVSHNKARNPWKSLEIDGVAQGDTILEIEKYYFNYGGGGIFVSGSSHAILQHLVVKENIAENTYGGGLYCMSSNALMKDLVVLNNTADGLGGGGGILLYSCDPVLKDIIVKSNAAPRGGGVCCWYNANPNLINLTIIENKAYKGGGLDCLGDASPFLTNVTIARNTNFGGEGGGIYCEYNSVPLFDSINRCNIYLNRSDDGNDLFSDAFLTIYADTFTVISPTGYHASPEHNFSFSILNGLFVQVDADLYVSPDGDNSNSGLSANEPLRNIYLASIKMLADSNNQHTIHLLEGTYSPSTTGELFPATIPEFVNIIGAAKEDVILDAAKTEGVLRFMNSISNQLTNMTISGGSTHFGGGIYSYNSNLLLNNITITGDSAFSGGGMYAFNSTIALENVTIYNNKGVYGGGINCTESNIEFANLDISGNQGHFGGGFYCISSDSTNIDRTSFRNNTSETGGAIYCVASSPVIKNTKIINNTADVGGGLYIIENSHPILQNVEISENIALDDVLGGGAILSYQSNPTLINATIIYNSAVKKGGGLYSIGSDPILINTIMWDNSPEEIFLHEWSIYPNTITTSYCDISGGEEGVISNVYDTIFWLEGNIDEDPLFAGGWEHPYAISKGSPCKDAGTPDTNGLFLPETDLAGGPRIWNNRIDMGAYEWNNVGFEDRQTFVSDLRIQTYPNPFTDNLTIEFEQMQSGNITITLLNQLGQQVAVLFSGNWQGGTFSFDVDGSGFPSGIYLIRLQAGDRTSVKKIIKY